ncbi:cbb3-type cytochrome oxidase subunit 3 [Arenimonas composti]|uniref:Cytochrome oxidase n=1 Tax=Arenimonas composti TR7-09 = DSM 18010 TaxID=1121013 RepID=A0A091C313_9GAMM|nr:cbb3-type cytochrome c oxidase subunit 3 [Arenimonas composti]KFN51015.1 hypothetical protein P873_04525 [Arenimonas composti TR7-09 = DSM 18010]
MLTGIVTLVAMAAFLGGVAWAMSSRRKREFDEAARLPLEEDDAREQDGKDK